MHKGVEHDRVFAFHRRAGTTFEPGRPKGQFHVCMNTPGLAVQKDLTEDNLEYFIMSAPESVWALAEYYGITQADQVSLWDTYGADHMCDVYKPYVSFLNLASVRELSRALGREIDPRRFRMNVWVEGLPPFAELAYVQQQKNPEKYPTQAGAISFGIDGLTVRCRAIEQDPHTGEFDGMLQKDLTDCIETLGFDAARQGAGKAAVMGWYGLPQNDGHLQVGDRVHFG